jgi:hypothetical protein
MPTAGGDEQSENDRERDWTESIHSSVKIM